MNVSQQLQQTQGSDAGENPVLLPWLEQGIAVGGENPARLTHTASGNVAICLKNDRLIVTCDRNLKIDGFPTLLTEHFCVSFDDHSCISILRYCAEKQTDKRR